MRDAGDDARAVSESEESGAILLHSITNVVASYLQPRFSVANLYKSFWYAGYAGYSGDTDTHA